MPLGTVWSPEEDQRLAELVKLHGPKKWSQIASDLGTAKGSKQCRRRWKNFLSLDERKLGSWTAEEDAQLLDFHRQHGNKWTLIAQEIGGRTDNAVKNRWAALEKKRRSGDDSACGHHQRGSSYSSRGGGGGSDLLGVRRVISKDQPQRSFTSRQYASMQQQQEEAVGGGQEAAAAAAAAAHHQQQQLDQDAFNMHAAAFGGQPAPMPGVGKPDLKINIPGATAPELPYSQRSQAAGAAADAARMHKTADGALTPVEVWLGSALNMDPQGVGGKGPSEVDDALLSTSRQGAHAAMEGLATPTEEPNTLQELYKFLYGATPAAQQLAAAGAGAAAAAAGGGGGHAGAGPAVWRDAVPSQQQQVPPAGSQMMPASLSAPSAYMGHQQHMLQQQQQQQMFHPGPPVSFMQQQQLPGRMMPPASSGGAGGLQQQFGQPPQMQMHMQQQPPLNRLHRTASGFEGPAGGPQHTQQPPEGMMLRQQLPPPQPRFVPQGPPGMSGGGAAPIMRLHSNAAVTTAAGGFEPAAGGGGGGRGGGAAQQRAPLMQGSAPTNDQQQQQHNMMHSRPVMTQAPAAPLMPQEPTLPAALPLQAHSMMQSAGPAAPQPPSQQWGAEELRQLLDILGEAAVSEGQQQGVLPPQGPAGLQLQQPPLCHMVLGGPHRADTKLEHANNATGSLTAAT